MKPNNKKETPLVFYPTFCETIRPEANGQFTYIGVFQSSISVDVFPYEFHQFSVAIAVIGTPDQLAGDVKISVCVDDRIVGGASIDGSAEGLTPNEDGLVFCNFHIIGNELIVHKPSSITANITINGVTYVSPNSVRLRKSGAKPSAQKGRAGTR
ncbi:hypothetical protein GCM10009125_00440 [Castellaniella daejeonensis]|uniref:Uncharacterized protein n=1 Tax=Castellaniella daejeonensis TaxID=659013 RepID=A0ABN0T8F8_9BURK